MLSVIANSTVPVTVARRAILPAVTVLPSRLALLPRRFMTTKASSETTEDKVIILGAAGRDFHDFITYWSKQPHTTVKCFTGTQIPGIDRRVFPAEMCNNHLNGDKYPNGLKIYPESELERLIAKTGANKCALAYSDLAYDTVQSLASRVNAAGCQFVQLPPALTMIPSVKPVVGICASRTGVGKSQTTRFIAEYYKRKGLKVAVVRHPMPYDQDLMKQRCQRYEKMEDMDKYHCTIEEREEYKNHIEEGNLLFAGVDYPMILHEAEQDADVVIWDGGNNDTPFYLPDLHITLVDALRPLDEEHYYPGEINVRMADVVLISKVDETNIDKADSHAEHLRKIVKPNTPIFYGSSVVSPEAFDKDTGKAMSTEDATNLVKGKRVLVIDDGPTLTHGGMSYGAGFVLAKQLGAAEIVDPRPYAQGSLKQVFEKFKHLENVLPAMGYSDEQVKDLEATIHAVPCDAVVVGTPSDIFHLMDLGKPSVTARYNLEVLPQHADAFEEYLDSFFDRYTQHHRTPPRQAA